MPGDREEARVTGTKAVVVSVGTGIPRETGIMGESRNIAFPCFLTFVFYCTVYYAKCCCIVNVDWSGWLGMAKFMEHKPYDF